MSAKKPAKSPKTRLRPNDRPRRQIRLRLTPSAAEQLAGLHYTVRAEIVALLVTTGLMDVDPAQLVGARQELVNLGRLLNQSLRVACGTAFDVSVAQRAVSIINALTKR